MSSKLPENCEDSEQENSPEKALLTAVIERTIRDALDQSGMAVCDKDEIKRLSKEAWAWLTSNSEDDFSFNWCCTYLEINAVRLRRWILLQKLTGKVSPFHVRRRIK